MYMDYIPAGDLMKLINKFERLDVPKTRFYFAQVVLALSYLHGKEMIYRDLKPENILIASTGHIKLADFGFLKTIPKGQKTYTFCGTPEYIAPEIILNLGYSQAVDWYAAGIMMFEMMASRPPFMSNDPMDLFNQSIKEKIKFPKHFDTAAKSLIKKLTKHDLTERYGNLYKGIQDIKDHRFFKDFDWSKILECNPQDSPYVPPAQEETKDDLFPIEQLPEGEDLTMYPPVKSAKDPFLNFF